MPQPWQVSTADLKFIYSFSKMSHAALGFCATAPGPKNVNKLGFLVGGLRQMARATSG